MVKLLTTLTAGMLLSLAAVAQSSPPAASSKAAPNAAQLYRTAIEELQRALPDREHEGEPAIPDLAPEGPEDFGSKQWRAAVQAGAGAITLFAQATQIPTCAFDKPAKQLETEFGNAVFHIIGLQRLTAAHCSQLASRDPGSALVGAIRLLQHANHCRQQQNLIGLSVAFVAEERAAEVLKVASKHLHGHVDQQALAGKFLNKLEQQLRNRVTRVMLADILEREFAWSLQEGLAELGRDAAIAAASKRAIEMHRELVQPLRKDAAITAEALRAHTKLQIQELQKLIKAKQLAAVLREGVGETLAAGMTLMISTDASRALEQSLRCEKLLHEQVLELRQLSGTKR